MIIVDFIILVLSLMLFSMFYVTDIQKREWCYQYIKFDSCSCMDDPHILVNRSISIDPFKDPIPNEFRNAIAENVYRVDKENAELLNKSVIPK